jgi:predicted RNA-binding Zn-ribbon protein involved in translation (DUF1610 family)
LPGRLVVRREILNLETLVRFQPWQLVLDKWVRGYYIGGVSKSLMAAWPQEGYYMSKQLKDLVCTKCGWTKPRGRGKPNEKCPKCGAEVVVREPKSAGPVPA